MDSDQEENAKKGLESGLVQNLQQALFPVINIPKMLSSQSSFFMNLLLKSDQENDDPQNQYICRKEQKDLLAIIKEPSSTIQPARWPTECQVLDEKVKHIHYVPPVPEPYYVPTGKEVQPKPVGEELGIVIYQYFPISAVNYFSRSSVNGSRYLLPTCPSPEEDSLIFESRFESGNLAKAIKITAIYYELYLRTDLYTNKHMQWFYFRITNMKKNIAYRLSIVNMTKDESLYNEGMKPLLYSTKDAQLHNIGWRRCGDNITYFCNDNGGTEDPDQLITYTLTFTLEFPHDEDMVYLAYSYPYTYTELQDYLLDLSKHPVKSTYTTLRLLCKTLAGNNLYYVTITAPQETEEIKRKRAVIITARVHPGESPSSWVMKGFLDFLTNDSGPAKELREKFIFKIVPMLNPDGVVVGNNRCSLTGKDLNRQYRTVIRESYPSIWYTKLLIRRMLEECGVAIYCDLHAHSRNHNIFIYGCENRRNSERRLGEQVFPLMLHKNAADKFSFESCKFRIQRCKEGTGRVVMWMMGIGNSYTMEASFCGSLLGTRAETHFSVQDYEQMGRAFCQTLVDFYDDDPRKERLRLKIVDRLLKEGSNADEPTNIPLSDYSSDEGSTSDSSSDEVGRYDYSSIQLSVPPPSPILFQRQCKFKTVQPKAKIIIKNVNNINESRKLLPLYRTNIDLTLPIQKTGYTTYSSSNSDSEKTSFIKKEKVVRKRYVKKRSKKHQKTCAKRSEKQKRNSPLRSTSVLEFSAYEKNALFSSQPSTGIVSAPKHLIDIKPIRKITQQLAEVQAKLLSLKNRLWMGVGEGDSNIPLSWGPSKISVHSLNYPRSQHKKQKDAENSSNYNKHDNKTHKKPNFKEERKKTANIKQNGMLRQMAVEWISFENTNKNKKRKQHSLEAPTKHKNELSITEKKDCENLDTKSSKLKKKKKKKSKLRSKAKIVSNANVFIKKD